jgi:hypothetical protein
MTSSSTLIKSVNNDLSFSTGRDEESQEELKNIWNLLFNSS